MSEVKFSIEEDHKSQNPQTAGDPFLYQVKILIPLERGNIGLVSVNKFLTKEDAEKVKEQLEAKLNPKQ